MRPIRNYIVDVLVLTVFCAIGYAQTEHDVVLCNVVNKKDGSAVTGESLKFSVNVHGRSVSNVHAHETRHPRRIMFVQDISASMRDNDARRRSAQVIQAFVAAASPDDQFGLVDVNDKYYLDITPNSAAAFLEKYNDPDFQERIRFFGGSALFDAISASAFYLGKEAQEGDSVIIISDGGDDASKMNSHDFTRQLEESKIRLYLFVLPAAKHPNPLDGRSRSTIMDTVRDSGGLMGKADAKDMTIQQWAETVHGLIETTNRIEFDVDAPVGLPAILDVSISTSDGKRDKGIEASCPRYLARQNP